MGGSRKVDIWNNVSKQRYVTIRDILVPFVTLRYEALRNRFSLGIFPWHMQKGLLQPLSPNATRTERWCYIFLCDNMVSYLIPANFHTSASLLFHSCAVSSSVQLARNFVNCEYHHGSWPCVCIVYLQSRRFALALFPDFKTYTRTFFSEIILNVDFKLCCLKLCEAKPELPCSHKKIM